MLHHGLYEQVINRQMAEELDSIAGARKAVAPIDRALNFDNFIYGFILNVLETPAYQARYGPACYSSQTPWKKADIPQVTKKRSRLW